MYMCASFCFKLESSWLCQQSLTSYTLYTAQTRVNRLTLKIVTYTDLILCDPT